MILIAAIMASFNFGEKQIKQFAKGVLIISLMSVILAFIQRFRSWYVSGFVERFYGIEWTRLEEIGIGARIVGTFGNSNVFGGSLAMLSALILAFATNIKGLTRYFSLAVFIGLGAAILVTTASRTALFGYLAVSGVSLILSLRRGSRFPAFLAMIVIIGTIMFVRGHVYELSLHQRVQDILTG
jgi:hypothetical protein